MTHPHLFIFLPFPINKVSLLSTIEEFIYGAPLYSGAIFMIHDWVSGQHQMGNFYESTSLFLSVNVSEFVCVCGCAVDCVFVRIQKNRQTLNCLTWM